MTTDGVISHAELHGSSQSKPENEESLKETHNGPGISSDEAEEDECIDLTKKIKVEDMKINTNKYSQGYQLEKV